jgi:hypothetical protein
VVIPELHALHVLHGVKKLIVFPEMDMNRQLLARFLGEKFSCCAEGAAHGDSLLYIWCDVLVKTRS